MFKRKKVKRLKAELSGIHQAHRQTQQQTRDAIEVVRLVTNRTRFKFNGASLIETRAQTHVDYVSVPLKIGEVKPSVGRARPVTREEMTAIDHGVFTIGEDRATFVGKKYQRTWEYQKIVGYHTDAASEVLIAVSDREKVSGIRYGQRLDFRVDAALNAAVERYRGNDAAVAAWAKVTNADLQAQLERGESYMATVGAEKAAELSELIGEDESKAFLETLAGVHERHD